MLYWTNNKNITITRSIFVRVYDPSYILDHKQTRHLWRQERNSATARDIFSRIYL